MSRDNRGEISPNEPQERRVRSMLTVVDEGEDTALSELGDYDAQLTEYEESLARGEIRWQ